MDDWNDFGAYRRDSSSSAALPPVHSAYTSEQGGSYASLVNSDVRSSSFTPFHDARYDDCDGGGDLGAPSGDLDDELDFEEMGLTTATESRSASSAVASRFHKRSYTKLEVISALQIQQIVYFFHIVIGLALSWTLFSLIVCNTIFVNNDNLPISPALLSEAQKANAIPYGRTTQVSRFSNTPPTPYTHLNLVQPPTVRTASTTEQQWFAKPLSDYTAMECYMRGLGYYNILLEWTRDLGRNCSAVNDPCWQHWEASCQGEAPQLETFVRQKGATADGPKHPVSPREHRFVNSRLRTVVVDSWYKAIVHLQLLAGGLVLLVLGTLFVIRLARSGRKNMSQEQLFAAALLFFSFMYYNVPYAAIQLRVVLLRGVRDFPDWVTQLEKPLKLMRDISLGPFVIFYLWANIHSYRILDPAESLGWAFYLPKLALLVPYCFVKSYAYFRDSIIYSESPFLPGILLAHSYRGYFLWRAYPALCTFTIVITLFEIGFVAIIVVQVVKTRRVLRRAPYMKHRSKQIGFRFFIYLNFVYYSTFFFLNVLLVVGRPVGEVLLSPMTGIHLVAVLPVHCVGPILLTFGYVLISAFINLPHDSVGTLKGWFVGTDLAPASSRWTSSSYTSDAMTESDYMSVGDSSNSLTMSYAGARFSPQDQPHPTFIVDKDYELNQQIVEPVTYRKRESDDALELKANCFTMQTHVIMFNFAWYVYYYGTPKFDCLKPSQNVLPFKFSVAESIVEPATDTHALVIDGVDRIIVAFKGTTSMRNLKTSLKIYHERLINVVPTDLDNQSELQRLRIIFGRSYEAAKIHKGFAIAYASVAHRVMRRIKKLIDERPRPVFLTGHSLGGALATICSLDVWIKLRISRRQIFVSTFGSPRVGNEAFRRIYNSVIALHWRIVVDPDMIAKLPKVGYRHVGKKVLLTPFGEMFIDPSQLELKLWSGNTAGFAYHRKASYLLAMRAWCVRHHKKTYTPAFWPFPVRDEDHQRFEDAQMQQDEDIVTPTSKLAKQIIMLDAMQVESLDESAYVNCEVIEKWSRLTRRLLLRQRLAANVANV